MFIIYYNEFNRHVEQKLLNQLEMIHSQAAVTIQKFRQQTKNKQKTKAKYLDDRKQQASRIITRQIRMYTRRLRYYHMWRAKQSIEM